MTIHFTSNSNIHPIKAYIMKQQFFHRYQNKAQQITLANSHFYLITINCFRQIQPSLQQGNINGMEDSSYLTPPEQKRIRRSKAKYSSQKKTTPVKRQLKSGEEADLLSLENLQAIFKKQYQKNPQLKVKFTQEDSIQKLSSREQLFAKLFQSDFNNKLFRSQFYSQLIIELNKMIKQSSKSVLDKMTQTELMEYQFIANDIGGLFDIKRSNEEVGNVGITKSRRIKSVIGSSLTIQMAFKFDVLSYFLKKNVQCQALYGIHLQTTIIQPLSLSKLFQLTLQQVAYHRDKYLQNYQLVQYEYYQQFKDIIDLTSLIELKYKIRNKQKRPREVEAQPCKINKKQMCIIQGSYLKESQAYFKFKYSQLAFLSLGIDVKELTSTKKANLFAALKQMINMKEQSEKRREFIRNKISFKVNFKSMCQLYDALLQNDEDYLTELEKQFDLKDKLQKCKWIFAQKCTVIDVLREITGCNLIQIQVANQKNYILTEVVLILLQRFQFYSTLLHTQLSFHHNLTGTQFIYIHKFQYSLIELRNYANPKLQEGLQPKQQKQDKKCTVMLAIFKNKLFFEAFIRQQIKDIKYFSIIKSIFKDYLKLGSKFSIVLYQFSLNNRGFDWKTFYYMRKFFKKSFNSHVYLANSPQYFKIHFQIDLLIKALFIKHHQSINRNNFYKKFEQILQGVISFRIQKPKQHVNADIQSACKHLSELLMKIDCNFCKQDRQVSCQSKWENITFKSFDICSQLKIDAHEHQNQIDIKPYSLLICNNYERMQMINAKVTPKVRQQVQDEVILFLKKYKFTFKEIKDRMKQVFRLTQALNIDFRDILEEQNQKQHESMQQKSKQIDKIEKELTNIFEEERKDILEVFPESGHHIINIFNMFEIQRSK